MTDNEVKTRFDMVAARFTAIEELLGKHTETATTLTALVERLVTIAENERRQNALRGNRTSKA